MRILASKTDSSWADYAASHIDEVLVDHAHLEKKAASTALGLIFRYPEHAGLARPLSELAREELSHFELVLDHLERRSVAFGRMRPSSYAGKLRAFERKEEPGRLLDTLLSCALIEARSLERMQLLSQALAGREPELSALYAGLLASEARHQALYLELARSLFPEGELTERLRVASAHEASVLLEGDREPRLHSV